MSIVHFISLCYYCCCLKSTIGLNQSLRFALRRQFTSTHMVDERLGAKSVLLLLLCFGSLFVLVHLYCMGIFSEPRIVLYGWIHAQCVWCTNNTVDYVLKPTKCLVLLRFFLLDRLFRLCKGTKQRSALLMLLSCFYGTDMRCGMA